MSDIFDFETGASQSELNNYLNNEGYDFFADPRNDPYRYNDLGPSPSNSEILSDINYDPGILSKIGSILSGGSGTMAQLAGLGGIGALLNSIGGSSGSGYKGYQGGIPQYTASRTQLPIPPSGSQSATPDGQGAPKRRPGSGGVTYFSPMRYTQASAPVGEQPTGIANLPAVNSAPPVNSPKVPAPNAPTAVVEAAQGGLMGLGSYSDGGRLLKGPGDGVSDDIPAMIGDKQPARLADGEFVIPARIVSEIGNGSTDAGARKLYAMMDRVQKARGKTLKNVAANSKSDKYLPA